MKKDTGDTKDWKLLARILPYAKPDAAMFIVALLITPLTALLSLAQPLLMKRALDDHITPGELDGLHDVALLYLGAVIASYVARTVYTTLVGISGERTILRLRDGIYRHLLALAPRFFDKRPAGELLTRATSDVEALGESLKGGVITILLDVLIVAGVLISMFALEWRMTLVLLLAAPPLYIVIEVLRRQLRVQFNRIRETLAAVNAYMAERVSGMEILQLFNHEDAAVERYIRLNTPYKDACIKSNIYDALMYAAVDGIGSMCIALMLWYATGDLIATVVSAGLVAAFIDLLNRLFRPLRELSQKITTIQRALAALDKIFRLMDSDDAIPDGELDLEAADGRLELHDVRFAYNEGDDILKGVDLTVNPGEVIAIVGPTGCGKTTLTRLVDRSYDGYRGSIQLDGHEVTDLSLRSVRQAVAAVRQDIQLFPETVRFNIALDNPRVDEAKLTDAAELVHASDFIKHLPGSWEHLLRQRGANVSVGEGQLLTFARAMAYDPAVIILDEATASIDPVTEQLVQDAIARILERKTVIVIAHRLSTISAADRILVLQGGEVAEVGNHEQLLAKGGLYAELHAAGFGEAV
ncbi:MAG: ABC transporter ATP-binding protein [Proteobacteria bacterium]|nr:ABC transporter ATP-binding protein [Pseudomonadota bacterium]